MKHKAIAPLRPAKRQALAALESPHQILKVTRRKCNTPAAATPCGRSFPLLDEAGNVSRLAGSTQDIKETRHAAEGLRELSTRLLKAQDEERRRIARELHDSTAQKLAAVKMQLGALSEMLGDANPAARQMLSESLALVADCSQEIRTLSYLLHPPLLDDLGLVSAIRSFADGFSKRSGLQVILELPEQLVRLPNLIELSLFRILQECLINVHRHSGSMTAWIHLARRSGHVALEVRDRGRGIRSEKSSRGLQSTMGVGIPGMKERVRELGGKLDIISSESGTTVRALVPIVQKTG
jgi:two-component system NarL family sensor kinase